MDNKIRVGKVCRIDGKFQRVELSDEDGEKVQAQQRHMNNNIMKECLEDATKFVEVGTENPYKSSVISIAVALFDKRAISNYTLTIACLDMKVQSLHKENGSVE